MSMNSIRVLPQEARGLCDAARHWPQLLSGRTAARIVSVSALFFGSACWQPIQEAAATSDGGADIVIGGSPDSGSSPGTVAPQIDKIVSDRSRLGARTTAGARVWHGGITLRGNQLYWVESGTAPGLYTADITKCPGDCVEKLATLTRPSAFSATAEDLLVSDINVIRRFNPTDKTLKSVASHADEITSLATDSVAAFWVADVDSHIRQTTSNGTTKTFMFSNGTPVALAIASDRLFWVGEDISGQYGGLQYATTDGGKAGEIATFNGGFQAMGGNASYLYFAGNNPVTIQRFAFTTGRIEDIGTGKNVVDFFVDANHAYWVEKGDSPDYLNGRVRRVAHDGVQVETLAESIPRPVAVVASGDTIYVASAVGSSRVDLQACKLEYSIVSPK